MSAAGGWSIDQVCNIIVGAQGYRIYHLTSASSSWSLLVWRVLKRWRQSIARTSVLVFLSAVGLAIKEAMVSSLLHISVRVSGHENTTKSDHVFRHVWVHADCLYA